MRPNEPQPLPAAEPGAVLVPLLALRDHGGSDGGGRHVTASPSCQSRHCRATLLAQHQGSTSLVGKAESSEMPHEAGLDGYWAVHAKCVISSWSDNIGNGSFRQYSSV
ncbi:hypothetical protein FGLOB1_13236 [Fusarium globosum]|uniref:Uncharacterized protein n=1 Tax=Fusarium globosum TaxID=78864 RepID=A0A8H5XN39_9HYPO|nr:hypothetical protein FGLOB1_13236 [Fusarium globosum]